jgi:hypothetical protein
MDDHLEILDVHAALGLLLLFDCVHTDSASESWTYISLDMVSSKATWRSCCFLHYVLVRDQPYHHAYA